MISDFIGWFFAILVVDPLQAHLQEQVERVRLPVEIVRQSQICLASQSAHLMERATSDYGWAAGTIIAVAIGRTTPSELLDEKIPECATLARALKDAGPDV